MPTGDEEPRVAVTSFPSLFLPVIIQTCSWLEFAGRSARATLGARATFFHPQPLVVFWFLDQPFSDRILANIVDGLSQGFISP